MKQILISKCDECPHAIFDDKGSQNHWGKWVCAANATEPDEFRLLIDHHVGYGPIPEWCPLDDY